MRQLTSKNGVSCTVDDAGFLLEKSCWDQEIAEEIASFHGLVLTEEHWYLIQEVRNFYQQYDKVPTMRPLVTLLKARDKRANSLYLHKLFPNSPAMVLASIAGLPRPENCF